MPDPPPWKPGAASGPPGETGHTDGPDGVHLGRLIGSRVVVRSLVPGERGPSGGPAMTDVVGVLELAGDDAIGVRRRDGELRMVPRRDILIVKRIPSPPDTDSRGSGRRRQPPDPQTSTDATTAP